MKGEIEQIREKKIEKDGTVYYLVKYHGYGEKRNTWEPYTKLCEMNMAVNKLIENFEEELNKKFKSDSNKILGGLTTITKIDETAIQIYANKKKNLIQQELYKSKHFINDMNNNFMNKNINMNIPMNNIDMSEINNNINNINIGNNIDNKKFNYQPKEVMDILYDPIKNKPIIKVKWNEINNASEKEKETEEAYNDFKVKFPFVLINFLEKKVKVKQLKRENESEQENNCDKILSEIINF